jgi:hypothetical protein
MAVGKTYFDRSKLYKVMRRIIELKKPGATRLAYLMKLAGVGSEGIDNKHSREQDKESFGIIIADFVAEKYEMEDGRVLFMSKATVEKASEQLLTVCIT